MKKQVIVFLAEGFEIIEAMTPVDFFRRADMDVATVSWNNRHQVVSSHGIPVIADKILPELSDEQVINTDLVVIPGGLPGASNLADTDRVIEVLQQVHDQGGMVAAICAGPLVLEKAGLLKDRRYTCYPGCEEKIKEGHYINRLVIHSDQIVTAKGPGASMHFALTLIQALNGKNAANDISKETFASESLKFEKK